MHPGASFDVVRLHVNIVQTDVADMNVREEKGSKLIQVCTPDGLLRSPRTQENDVVWALFKTIFKRESKMWRESKK